MQVLSSELIEELALGEAVAPLVQVVDVDVAGYPVRRRQVEEPLQLEFDRRCLARSSGHCDICRCPLETSQRFDADVASGHGDFKLTEGMEVVDFVCWTHAMKTRHRVYSLDHPMPRAGSVQARANHSTL